MLREEMTKRLKDLPDIILEAKEVCDLDLLRHTIHLMWSHKIAYFLIGYENNERVSKYSRYYIYNNWKVIMKMPKQEERLC